MHASCAIGSRTSFGSIGHVFTQKAHIEAVHMYAAFDVGGEALLCCNPCRGRSTGIVPGCWALGQTKRRYHSLPASVAGIALPPGRYSVYSVPEPDAWTVVINRSIRQSGRTHDEVGVRGNRFPNAYVGVVARAEIGRAPVPTQPCAFQEQLTVTPTEGDADQTLLTFEWERRAFHIPIERRR